MCSAETPIKTDRVKEDKKVSLEEKLELLEDIMDYDDQLYFLHTMMNQQ